MKKRVKKRGREAGLTGMACLPVRAKRSRTVPKPEDGPVSPTTFSTADDYLEYVRNEREGMDDIVVCQLDAASVGAPVGADAVGNGNAVGGVKSMVDAFSFARRPESWEEVGDECEFFF